MKHDKNDLERAGVIAWETKYTANNFKNVKVIGKALYGIDILIDILQQLKDKDLKEINGDTEIEISLLEEKPWYPLRIRAKGERHNYTIWIAPRVHKSYSNYKEKW